MYQVITRNFFGDKEDPEIRLVIIRHGERIDSKYGPYWYTNQTALSDIFAWPPSRKNPNDYILDPPLTINGAYNASKAGQILMGSNNINFEYCFSSPALRCLQTARCVLQADRRQTIPIYICPNLYECYGWMGGPWQNPKFITLDEWKTAGLNCLSMKDTTKKIAFPNFLKMRNFGSDQRPDEDEMSYYQRSAEQMRDIIALLDGSINRRPANGGSSTINCLVVGHAPTAEVLTHDILGRRPNVAIVRQMASYVSFLCMVIAERTKGQWALNNMPLVGTSVNNVQRPT